MIGEFQTAARTAQMFQGRIMLVCSIRERRLMEQGRNYLLEVRDFDGADDIGHTRPQLEI